MVSYFEYTEFLVVTKNINLNGLFFKTLFGNKNGL